MAKKIETVQVAKSPDNVLATAKGVLSEMGGSIKEEGSGRLVSHITPSIWSWGEAVTITATGEGAGSQVEVESRSRMPLTLIDWGKNGRNVERVIEGLS